MASAVLSTLEHVTFRKLQRLAEQRKRFEGQKSSILKVAGEKNAETDKVRALLEGFRSNSISLLDSTTHVNIEYFVDQADHDPSISQALLQQWRQSLEHELDMHSLKYEYATLFGKLVTEWIAAEGTKSSGPSSGDRGADSVSISISYATSLQTLLSNKGQFCAMAARLL